MGTEKKRAHVQPRQSQEHLDDLLDEALEETFPASDAVSITWNITKILRQPSWRLRSSNGFWLRSAATVVCRAATNDTHKAAASFDRLANVRRSLSVNNCRLQVVTLKPSGKLTRNSKVEPASWAHSYNAEIGLARLARTGRQDDPS